MENPATAQSKSRFLSALLLSTLQLVVTSTVASGQSPSGLEGIDELVTAAMEEWKVPGLAIAVVRDGEVILSRGYGYRALEKQLPVTPRTLFAIGSITKSFTVAVLGTLVDEGRLDWDRPVRNYLPAFELQDPVATLQMTPRDLVTHRSGLPRHDALWYGASLTREEMFHRLRYLEPTAELRATWQYQNLMFMTAGYLAGQTAGTTWEDLTREKILAPLGMERSNFSVHESQRSDDYALPYNIDEDKQVRRVHFRNLDAIGPAGSINSSVEEMIRYVEFHINKGKWGEKQILSEANAVQMHTPQMVIQGPVEYEELGHASYGLGLVVTTYRGHRLVHHGGGIDGFISLLSFMPSEEMGVIVLTNLSGANPVPTIVTHGVYDRLLGLQPIPWIERRKEDQRKVEQAEEEAEKKGYVGRKEGTRPTHALADYVGTYEHPGYGAIQITLDGEQLMATFHGETSRLTHFHYDIFEIPEDPLNPLGDVKLTFFYDKKGDIDRLAAPLEPQVGDIIFARAADPSMRERSFLEPFVGEYQLGPTTVSVRLQGDDALVLSIPGQPTRELVPTRGTSFDIQGVEGQSIEFKKDVSGAVIEAVLYTPSGTYVAKKQ